MLVVVVVSVLAAIAIPSYDLFVKRSRRSEARAALSDLAAMQEQYFLDNKRYAPTLDDLGGRTVTENGYYAMSLPVATTFEYTIRATAQGGQADDTDCATMSVTRAGSKLPLDCW